MYYKVYKALDKSRSLFGLRGTYFNYCLMGVLASAVLSLVVGGATNGLFGIILFIILIAVSYAITLRVQARFSEKERTKWFCMHYLPNYVKVPPRRLSSYSTLRQGNASTSRHENRNQDSNRR